MSLPRLLLKVTTLCLRICGWNISSTNATIHARNDLIASSSNISLGVVDLGIRFAAPPTGPLRWQPPQKPALNRSSVESAASYGPICPQSFNAVPGNDFVLGDEDCLFLNVYAPAKAVNLPVLVWIHGGGFIGVGIQYRLGAFGFLSSDEVLRNGVVNAGLLDQKFAFEWIQEHIAKFGGDPSKVAIAGLSAGAGSVMLHTIAYGGSLGTSLFTNSITASPYLPTQYNYNDFLPTQAYYAFATAAGCPPTFAYGNSSQTIFRCLQSQDTLTLQQASHNISTSGTFGSWAFLPVTDGDFIRETPSQALLKRKINGRKHLTSNTAEEGPAYTPQTITTEDGLTAWLLHTFPLLKVEDAQKVLHYYPFTPPAGNSTLPRYPTSGDSGATAVTMSQIASGHQQRANAILGETTFMCPSYWLATAFSSPQTGHHSYKYQYSIPTALHGYDLEAYFGPARRNQGPKLTRALQVSWGNFVRFGDPSIPSSVIANAENGNSGSNTASELERWPEFSSVSPRMAIFNQTGGTPYEFTAVQVRNDGPLTVVADRDMNVTLHSEPGLRNDVRLVDAYTWEGGRGMRCDFWRSIAAMVPE
ncbi:putative inactive carboxylesterase 4 protein [Eutypa lata UCREL1]|uniref:Carboxylic ester hydrolase n=1 Tax=Eutypa lata (strain UCR-EL1) TaxID=1287681 RepID=M7TMB8_EUTLA|nr:putative inactive carboxylesterase 4 protein [Eutypa lata UCREL1]